MGCWWSQNHPVPRRQTLFLFVPSGSWLDSCGYYSHATGLKSLHPSVRNWRLQSFCVQDKFLSLQPPHSRVTGTAHVGRTSCIRTTVNPGSIRCVNSLIMALRDETCSSQTSICVKLNNNVECDEILLLLQYFKYIFPQQEARIKNSSWCNE